MDDEDDWQKFLESGDINRNDVNENTYQEPPKPSLLYISTKTKIIYLNRNLDLNDLFWKIKIMPYDSECSGIIKKQMKFISTSKEELDDLTSKINNYKYHTEYIIKHVEQQQTNVITYKDVRKVTIGVSNKDLLNSRSKQKSAFYNCFVIIIRILFDDIFKEVHLKVFNTGKIEIPGVQNETLFNRTLEYLKSILTELCDNDKSIEFLHDKTETVLINSNFDCGFCINRTNLFDILKNKYNLNVSYDPCSYPGIQCKYEIHDKTVSFMIFRTGSILIVGRCEENTIESVYIYLKDLLINEHSLICEKYSISSIKNKDSTKKVIKTKTIYL